MNRNAARWFSHQTPDFQHNSTVIFVILLMKAYSNDRRNTTASRWQYDTLWIRILHIHTHTLTTNTLLKWMTQWVCDCVCVWQQRYHSWSHNSITHNFGFILFTQIIASAAFLNSFCGRLFFVRFSRRWNEWITTKKTFWPMFYIWYNMLIAYIYSYTSWNCLHFG